MAGRQIDKKQAVATGQGAMPYYEHLANVLRVEIVDADQGQTVRLPTERELGRLHGTSRVTIRKAMDILEREGLIERAPSRGTLTVPKAIRQWKRLRQDRVIHVVTGWQPLTGPLSAPYYGRIYQGVLSRCEQTGYRPKPQQISVHRTQLSNDLRPPKTDMTLGVILLGLTHEAIIQFYVDQGFPVVVIDHWTTNPRADSIIVDCFGEGQIAADLLIRHGHTQFFFVGNKETYGPVLEEEPDAELLLAGLQRGLKLAGLAPLPPERTRFFGRCEIAETVGWYLSIKPRPTAGLIFDCGLATEFICQMGRHKIRCPEDVSIISKAGAPTNSHLTSLQTDATRLGVTAVDCLLEKAGETRTNAVRIAIPSQLNRGRTVSHR